MQYDQIFKKKKSHKDEKVFVRTGLLMYTMNQRALCHIQPVPVAEISQ